MAPGLTMAYKSPIIWFPLTSWSHPPSLLSSRTVFHTMLEQCTHYPPSEPVYTQHPHSTFSYFFKCQLKCHSIMSPSLITLHKISTSPPAHLWPCSTSLHRIYHLYAIFTLFTLCSVHVEQYLAQRRNSNEFLKIFSHIASHLMLMTALKISEQ